jgi:hypothetical protein
MQLVLLMETHCVYCDVETEFLYDLRQNAGSKGLQYGSKS